jgi:DNA-binding CsgD family transcriptional regulator
MMSAARRILLAVRDPCQVVAVRDALLDMPGMQLTGIVDPTIDRALGGWSEYADILLIGADELLWLHRADASGFHAALTAMRVIVLLDESRILDLFYQTDERFDLVFAVEDRRSLAHRIDLATAGYLVLPTALLVQWVSNHLRRRLLDELSPNERRVLSCVGRALSNKSIATETGFSESEVKALIQSTMRKLRIKNRTTVAIFAASLEPAEPHCAE